MPVHLEYKLSLKSLPRMQSLIAQRLLLVAIGALYPLGFSPFGFWPLALVSIILLVNEVISYCHEQNIPAVSSTEEQKLSLFSIGLYWAFGAFGVGTSWVYVSIHEYGNAPVIGAIGISFLFVLTLSLVKAAGIYCIGKLNRWLGNGLLILLIPFCWVVFEFVQTKLFSGFPWLFAGYTQTDGPLWMLATWVGVYGVSWFMLAICSCVVVVGRHFWMVSSIQNHHKGGKNDNKDESLPIERANKYLNESRLARPQSLALLFLLSVPLLALVVQTPIIHPKKSSLDVALVQPNVSQEIKWDRRYFSRIVDILYTQSEDHWGAELLIWPEGAIPAYKHQVNDIISDLERKAIQTKTDLFLGLPIYQADHDTSYAAFISLGRSPQTYHKQVLVPFGEYVPLGQWLRGIIEFLNLPMSSFSPATQEQHPMNFEQYQVIPAICYEITYPGIVHDLMVDADQASSKPKLLVTVSNDAWFGDSFGPYQHMQIARMRALELGIPLVRATNDGITAIVDARGNMLKSLARYSQATLRYKVSLDNYQTLYRKYGLWGIYFILLTNIVIFLIARLKNRKFSTLTKKEV
jgi:apolipoprotein N-acyltransferase